MNSWNSSKKKKNYIIQRKCCEIGEPLNVGHPSLSTHRLFNDENTEFLLLFIFLDTYETFNYALSFKKSERYVSDVCNKNFKLCRIVFRLKVMQYAWINNNTSTSIR